MKTWVGVAASAAAAGLLTLALLGVVDAAAGPSTCASNLVDTVCTDDPGPSLGTSLLTSAVVATGAAVLRWRKGDRRGG